MHFSLLDGILYIGKGKKPLLSHVFDSTERISVFIQSDRGLYGLYVTLRVQVNAGSHLELQCIVGSKAVGV